MESNQARERSAPAMTEAIGALLNRHLRGPLDPVALEMAGRYFLSEWEMPSTTEWWATERFLLAYLVYDAYATERRSNER